jgi:hypothetical protein
MATAADVIRVETSQVGTHETPYNRTPYGQWYGMNGVAWCDIFQSWGFAKANALSAIGGKFALTTAHAAWFKAKGKWGSTPQIGALVFYDWGGGKSISGIDHVGLVIGVSGGTITTVEGNSSDAVKQRQRSATAYVVGYGYPAYDGSSTDPSIPSATPAGLIPGQDQITAVYNVLQAMLKPHFWLRVGCVIIGMLLTGVGVTKVAL